LAKLSYGWLPLQLHQKNKIKKKTVVPILFYFSFFSQYTNRKTASSQNISNYSKKIENEK
jgi:hypothetical protein